MTGDFAQDTSSAAPPPASSRPHPIATGSPSNGSRSDSPHPLQNTTCVANCTVRSAFPLGFPYNNLNKQAVVDCPPQKKRSPERLSAAFCNAPKIFCGFQISPNSFIRRELAICCKKLAQIVLISGGT